MAAFYFATERSGHWVIEMRTAWDFQSPNGPITQSLNFGYPV
jgi:hypothetical protein